MRPRPTATGEPKRPEDKSSGNQALSAEKATIENQMHAFVSGEQSTNHEAERAELAATTTGNE